MGAGALGVPGILAFVWLTLIATLIHLDLFHLDSNGFAAQLAAWVWLAVYVVEPPVLTWAFVAQLRAPGRGPAPPRPAAAAPPALLTGLAGASCSSSAWRCSSRPSTSRSSGRGR